MVYTARDIKDRVAIGDNKYYMTDLGDGRVMLTPAPDSVVEVGTDINREILQLMEERICLLMNRVFTDITANPFIMNFTTLGGLSVKGVWDETMARVEC